MYFLSFTDLLSGLVPALPPPPSALRVRQVLDRMGGSSRAALRRLISFGDAPALETHAYPSALLSYFPRSQKYAFLGILAEKLVCKPAADIAAALPAAVVDTYAAFGLPCDLAGFDKVLKSKTTEPFLNLLITTRYTMDVHINGDLVCNSVLKGKGLLGHPDARTHDQVYEIKLTGELEKNWPYFLCQVHAYAALDPAVKSVYLVLPLQAAVVRFDVTDWTKRAEFATRLTDAAAALLAPAPVPAPRPSPAPGLAILAKYAIGSHEAKLPTLADTVAALPSGKPSQIFVGSPSSTKMSIKDADVAAAAATVARRGLQVYIHAPYILNLAELGSGDDWALNLLKKNLHVGTALGCRGVVVHVGKSKTMPIATAVENMRVNIARVLPHASTGCPLLLETPAGQGTELLRTPDDFIGFVKSFEDARFRACLDTCHVFACGHDPVTYVEAMTATPDLLRLVHFNDSVEICGACKDRHAFVGTGKIGAEVLTAVAERCSAAKIPMVVE